jgi:hypothetical protein
MYTLSKKSSLAPACLHASMALLMTRGHMSSQTCSVVLESHEQVHHARARDSANGLILVHEIGGEYFGRTWRRRRSAAHQAKRLIPRREKPDEFVADGAAAPRMVIIRKLAQRKARLVVGPVCPRLSSIQRGDANAPVTSTRLRPVACSETRPAMQEPRDRAASWLGVWLRDGTALRTSFGHTPARCQDLMPNKAHNCARV